jgi:alginate O-acetyltransferase complex protein AlgI
MVFNSFAFAPFLLLAVASQLLRWPWSARKLCLIALSYVFYAAWYPWALSLLLASTLFDFHVGKALENPRLAAWRRLLLVGSVVLNLGVLFSFKYLGFAIHNLNELAGALGWAARFQPPSTLLPVGISFYTFMSLSYVTDVYRQARRAERSLLDFALFLSFFPHLVAGPIVRANDFLAQCKSERRPSSQAILWGLALLLFGLFQKVVLADAWFAPISDRVFAAQPERISTVDAWLGAIAFSGQIFCDFAGYSTCAIGAAACLGYHLPENFRSPYTALGFSDFWRRWHITLSAWLRDYVYVSLGGNRVAPWRVWLNLMLTMLLGGLWHGASWTFVAWGALHGGFLCAERAVRWLAVRFTLNLTPLLSVVVVLVTLLSVTWAWVFFRASSFSFAIELTRRLCGLGSASSRLIGNVDALLVVLPAAGLLAAQWVGRDRTLAELADKAPRPVLAVGLVCLLVAIVTMAGEDRAFIYFQF